MKRPPPNSLTLIALLAALMLRAGIPDGYMPATAGSGLLFELCPAGVPESFMRALSGSDHHQHHADTASPGSHYDTGQCPIGHMLSSAAAFDDLWQIESAPAVQESIGITLPAYTRQAAISQRSRGPPA